MKKILHISLCLLPLYVKSQTPAAVSTAGPDLFKECNLTGSTTIYNYEHKQWIFSDSQDAHLATVPASTFKVINLLIALETGVIKDENDIVKWVGKIDTSLYGYRPGTYRDMTVREAFQISAGWVFIELAKKVGKKRYRHYLERCRYGNGDPSENKNDFWNFGPLTISPANQIEFLVKVYEGRLPFSKRNLDILKNVMVTEKKNTHVIRSKTGWGVQNGNDIGWWIGYVERNNNVYFFATRLTKSRNKSNPEFYRCRMSITRKILRRINALP